MNMKLFAVTYERAHRRGWFLAVKLLTKVLIFIKRQRKDSDCVKFHGVGCVDNFIRH